MYSFWTHFAAASVGALISAAVLWRALRTLKLRNKDLERFRIAVDTSGDSIYVTDRKTMRFVDMSQSAIQRSGYSREELTRMGPQDYVKDRDPADVARAFDAVIAAGNTGTVSEQISTLKDGSQIYSENFRRAFQIDGTWLIVSSSRNVTERKTAELALRRLSRILGASNATNEVIMRSPTPGELYDAICEAAVNGANFANASVCLVEPGSSYAKVVAVFGAGAKHVREIPICIDEKEETGRGLVGTAIRSQAPCISNDLLNDDRLAYGRERSRKLGVASAAAIPFERNNTVCGVLLLYSTEMNVFDAEIVELLSRIARNVGFALDHFDLEIERNRAEQQLRATEARLNRVTRGTNDGLWEKDLQNGAVWFSPRFAEILGYTAEELQNKDRKLIDLVCSEDRTLYTEALTACIELDVPFDVELRAKAANGEYRWIRLRAACQRDASGKAETISGSQQDITERKHYQQALLEATETAAAANSAKSEFLANMSHEIRTPMNGVIGMTDLLLETPLNPMQRYYAETVKQSAGALLTVINDILDFSKIEAGKLELDSTEMDVTDTVEDVARLLSIQAHAKGVEVIAMTDATLPHTVSGDPGRLRQVLLNLGGNAVKFTQQGEVSIFCKVIEQDTSGLLVRFEVSDTGIGIPQSRIDALFQPFTQADASTTRKFGGTGLGLSIVKRLANLMQGEVGATSVEGKGSTFWFTARFRVSAEGAKSCPPPPVELKGQRALIVDDNATNRKVIMGQLTLCQMETVCVSSADEALTIMRQAAAAGRPFEVALLDHQMPGYDGAKLGKAINSEQELRVTRLILLTSSGQRGDGQKFADLGFAGYLLKPVTRRDLIDCLSMVLGVRAEAWHEKSQPIVTGHVLRSQRTQEPYRILLAEDNLVNQKVAARMLEKLGYRVDIAADGEATVNAWASGVYDLILMDCQMPIMDGYEATRTIRARELNNKRIPIVALTAHAMKGADDKCIAAGMDDYLSKPLDRSQLDGCIRRWLERQAA
jgi:PAS domain S-box-containing protein